MRDWITVRDDSGEFIEGSSMMVEVHAHLPDGRTLVYEGGHGETKLIVACRVPEKPACLVVNGLHTHPRSAVDEMAEAVEIDHRKRA